MPEWLLALATLPLVMGAGIALAVYSSVKGMSRPGVGLVPAGPELRPGEQAHVGELHAWASEQGFQWAGSYLYQAGQTILVAAWRRPEHSTFFCAYLHPRRVAYDMVSIFSDRWSLTTGSSPDAQLLPRPPGALAQSFSTRSLPQLWERHLEASRYLTECCGVPRQGLDLDFPTAVARAQERALAHVRSLPLWPIRGVYWYLVRRHRLHNRSIQEQYPAGLPVLDPVA